MKRITIPENVIIPGTNIELEEGDQIEVLKEGADLNGVVSVLKTAIEKSFRLIVKQNPDYDERRAFQTLLGVVERQLPRVASGKVDINWSEE